VLRVMLQLLGTYLHLPRTWYTRVEASHAQIQSRKTSESGHETSDHYCRRCHTARRPADLSVPAGSSGTTRKNRARPIHVTGIFSQRTRITGRSIVSGPQRHYLPALRTPISQPHYPISARSMDSHRPQGLGPQNFVSASSIRSHVRPRSEEHTSE